MLIYSSPITVAEHNEAFKYVKNKDDLEGIVRLVILKARDSNGKPLFEKQDRYALMNSADGKVVMRVGAQLMAVGAPEGAELGNS